MIDFFLGFTIDRYERSFRSDAVQNLRQRLFTPVICRLNIRRALERANFVFHRHCSLQNLSEQSPPRQLSAGEVLMFWGVEDYDTGPTMSVSSESSMNTVMGAVNARDPELRSTSQQTDISCRYLMPGIASPVSGGAADEGRGRGRLTDTLLPYSPPAQSPLHAPARSRSLLGSVCALLMHKQGSSVGDKEVSSYPGTPGSDICRICFGGESAERLVRPCSCRGTIAAVHRSCLERWLLQAATSYCELCRHHYVVTRTHKWCWVSSLWSWAVSGRGGALAADAWRGAALGAASVLGTARALHACDVVLQAGARRGGGAALAANLFSSLLIGIIGALNGLLTTWMLLKIQEHQLAWQAWRDSTLHVHVTLDDDAPAMRDSPSDTRARVTPTHATADRATNVADPFMVAVPYTLPEVPDP